MRDQDSVQRKTSRICMSVMEMLRWMFIIVHSQHKCIYCDKGTLPGTVHFTTDVTVDPKVVSPKRVPLG